MTIPTALAKLEQAKKVEQRGYAIADQLSYEAAREHRAMTRHEAMSLRMEAVVGAVAAWEEHLRGLDRGGVDRALVTCRVCHGTGHGYGLKGMTEPCSGCGGSGEVRV